MLKFSEYMNEAPKSIKRIKMASIGKDGGIYKELEVSGNNAKKLLDNLEKSSGLSNDEIYTSLRGEFGYGRFDNKFNKDNRVLGFFSKEQKDKISVDDMEKEANKRYEKK